MSSRIRNNSNKESNNKVNEAIINKNKDKQKTSNVKDKQNRNKLSAIKEENNEVLLTSVKKEQQEDFDFNNFNFDDIQFSQFKKVHSPLQSQIKLANLIKTTQREGGDNLENELNMDEVMKLVLESGNNKQQQNVLKDYEISNINDLTFNKNSKFNEKSNIKRASLNNLTGNRQSINSKINTSIDEEIVELENYGSNFNGLIRIFKQMFNKMQTRIENLENQLSSINYIDKNIFNEDISNITNINNNLSQNSSKHTSNIKTINSTKKIFSDEIKNENKNIYDISVDNINSNIVNDPFEGSEEFDFKNLDDSEFDNIFSNIKTQRQLSQTSDGNNLEFNSNLNSDKNKHLNKLKEEKALKNINDNHNKQKKENFKSKKENFFDEIEDDDFDEFLKNVKNKKVKSFNIENGFESGKNFQISNKGYDDNLNNSGTNYQNNNFEGFSSLNKAIVKPSTKPTNPRILKLMQEMEEDIEMDDILEDDDLTSNDLNNTISFAPIQEDMLESKSYEKGFSKFSNSHLKNNSQSKNILNSKEELSKTSNLNFKSNNQIKNQNEDSKFLKPESVKNKSILDEIGTKRKHDDISKSSIDTVNVADEQDLVKHSKQKKLNNGFKIQEKNNNNNNNKIINKSQQKFTNSICIPPPEKQSYPASLPKINNMHELILITQQNVSQKISIQQTLTQKNLIVPPNNESININNVSQYQFQCLCINSSNDIKNCEYCNESYIINKDNFRSCLLTYLKSNKNFTSFALFEKVPNEWFFYQYKFLVFKYYLLNKIKELEEESDEYINNKLNVEAFLNHASEKYLLVNESGKRSILTKVKERDSSLNKNVILILLSITKTEINSKLCYTLELSDGYSSAYAEFLQFSPVYNLIQKNYIYSGMKLNINNSKVERRGEELYLTFCYNSLAKADFESKLGLVKDKQFLIKNIGNLREDGGEIGLIDVIILKKYDYYCYDFNTKKRYSSSMLEKLIEDSHSKREDNMRQISGVDNSLQSESSLIPSYDKISYNFKVICVDTLLYLKYLDDENIQQFDTINFTNLHFNLFRKCSIEFAVKNLNMHEELTVGNRYQIAFLNFKTGYLGQPENRTLRLRGGDFTILKKISDKFINKKENPHIYKQLISKLCEDIKYSLEEREISEYLLSTNFEKNNIQNAEFTCIGRIVKVIKHKDFHYLILTNIEDSFLIIKLHADSFYDIKSFNSYVSNNTIVIFQNVHFQIVYYFKNDKLSVFHESLNEEDVTDKITFLETGNYTQIKTKPYGRFIEIAKMLKDKVKGNMVNNNKNDKLLEGIVNSIISQ